MVDRIYILDEIVTSPVDCSALRDEHVERYIPSAQLRGMRLEGAWRTPAPELTDRPATLYFLWSVEGVAEWWRMRLGDAWGDGESGVIDIAGAAESKAEWWAYVDSRALSRKRSFLVGLGQDNTDVKRSSSHRPRPRCGARAAG